MQENFDTDEDYYRESEELMSELDRLEGELHEILRLEEIQSAAYDKAFAWFEVEADFPPIINAYRANVASLGKILPFLSDSKSDRFARGTVLVGLVSAYEALVHDLILLCCKSHALVSKAVENLEKLSPRDKSYLGFKKEPSRNDLIEKLKIKTLHDPAQVAQLCNVLFELPLPSPHEQEVRFYDSLLRARNSYTHVGGYLDGKEFKVTMKVLDFAFRYFHVLVDSYAQHIQDRARSASEEASKT